MNPISYIPVRRLHKTGGVAGRATVQSDGGASEVRDDQNRLRLRRVVRFAHQRASLSRARRR